MSKITWQFDIKEMATLIKIGYFVITLYIHFGNGQVPSNTTEKKYMESFASKPL